MNQKLNKKLADIIDQLTEASNQKESPESSEIKLGQEALDLIEKLLLETPTDSYPRFMRMKVHAWVLENTQKIIEEAQYIIDNATNDEDKNSAYNWLAWAYDIKLAMPEKSIEVLQEQVMSLYGMFKDKIYRRDEIIGYALNTMAYLYQNMGKAEEALNTWVKSFEDYPYIHNRNGEAGLKLLEAERFDEATDILYVFFYWSDGEEGNETLINIGKKLKELLQLNKLGKNPNLIALYYSILRNEREAFAIKDNTDFIKKHKDDLLKWTEIFPQCSFLWVVLINTYYHAKDYKKTIQAFISSQNGDNPQYPFVERIFECCKKSKYDFFSLPFIFKGNSNNLYNILTQLNTIYDDTDDDRLLEIVYQYGKVAYQQYTDYLYHGKGSTLSNLPYPFAMFCNNYGNLLEYLAATKQGEEQKTMMQLAANVHWQGYQMSPFQENIENAIDPAFYGELYEDCVKYADIYLNEYADNEDEDDVEDKKRTRLAALAKLQQLQSSVGSETPITFPKIFSDSSFSDEADWQAQLPNFKKLFELLQPEFQNLEYAVEEKTQLIFEWNGYTIKICSGELNRSGVLIADNIEITNDEGMIIFQSLNIEKKNGIFFRKKEIQTVLKIKLLPKGADNETTYKFGLETELLAQMNLLWAEILNCAEKGNYFINKLNTEITKEKILDILNLPVVQEKYNDYWDSDKMGFIIGDYHLIFCHHGAIYKKRAYPGKVVVGISNRKKGASFDLKKYYFAINSFENPTSVYLHYLSSQLGNNSDRYDDNNLYVPSLDWEIYQQALLAYQSGYLLVIAENERYLNQKREDLTIKGYKQYVYEKDGLVYNLKGRLDAENIVAQIRDFNNNSPLDIFKTEFQWEGSRVFLDEYYLFCDEEVILSELDLNFQPEGFNIIGYIFDKKVSIENILYANESPVVPSFIALEDAEIETIILDGGVHYINDNLNSNFIILKNAGQLIVKNKLTSHLLAAENFEVQIGDFNIECFEDYTSDCIKLWGAFADENGKIVKRELCPFPPTNNLELFVNAEYLIPHSHHRAYINQNKIIEALQQNPDTEIIDYDKFEEYLKDFDNTLTQRVANIFSHTEIAKLEEGQLYKMERYGNEKTYYYFSKEKENIQIGFWNLEEHYVNFFVQNNNSKIEWNVTYYQDDNITGRFGYSTKNTDNFAITHAGKRMLLEAEDILLNNQSKLRKMANQENLNLVFNRLINSPLVPDGNDPEDNYLFIDISTLYRLQRSGNLNREMKIGVSSFNFSGASITIYGDDLLFRLKEENNQVNVYYWTNYAPYNEVNDNDSSMKRLDLEASSEINNKLIVFMLDLANRISYQESNPEAYDEFNYQIEEEDEGRNILKGCYKIIFPNPYQGEKISATEIARIKNQFHFSQHYAEFLKIQNGFDGYEFEQADVEDIQPYLVSESIEEIDGGVGVYFKFLYPAELLAECNSTDNNIFKDYLLMIGNDSGGNNYVEVLHGKYKGYIGCIDHEMYLGSESLEEFVENFELENFFNTSKDQCCDMLCDEEIMMIFHAKNFKEFIEECFYYIDGDVLVKVND